MFARIFLELTEYAFFRRLVWKPIYEMLARVLPLAEWRLMNYGYTPTSEEAPLTLEPDDELHRYPIQLYHYLAARVNLQGAQVLEVGSGRGGGAHFIARYHQPASYIGMDLAKNAVKFARKQFKLTNLSYVQGNAEALPFADEQFDAVVNVESCHAYGSVPKFLSEVRRFSAREAACSSQICAASQAWTRSRNNSKKAACKSSRKQTSPSKWRRPSSRRAD